MPFEYVTPSSSCGDCLSHGLGVSCQEWRMAARESRERLIDEVKKFPVLYDTRHEHHRDIDVRDRCWTDIATRLNTNSEVLKREWKILRDCLRQSLRNSRSTTKTGLPSKRWGLQARMSFLLPYMTKRKPRITQRVEFKADVDSLEPEHSEGDPGEREGVEEWPPVGGVLRDEEVRVGDGDPSHDALELFFASVCASARLLPVAQQRVLKRQVLDALLQCEAEADTPAYSAQLAASSNMNYFKH